MYSGCSPLWTKSNMIKYAKLIAQTMFKVKHNCRKDKHSLTSEESIRLALRVANKLQQRLGY